MADIVFVEAVKHALCRILSELEGISVLSVEFRQKKDKDTGKILEEFVRYILELPNDKVTLGPLSRGRFDVKCMNTEMSVRPEDLDIADYIVDSFENLEISFMNMQNIYFRCTALTCKKVV